MADGYLNTPANSPGLFIGADPDWELKQQQVAQADTFRNGLPTDAAGNPDYNAMAKALLQKGAFTPATSLLGVGIQQQGIRMGLDAANALGNGGVPPAGASPAPSTKGANPEVVSFIRDEAQKRGINPNVALAVAGSEGLNGFDPAGNANLGDGGSSAGPFQLHYGGVAPGSNAGSGLGDAFTKATGLDARDPSTWKQQVAFALDSAAKGGWSPWNGAKRIGITGMLGIGAVPPASAGSVTAAASAPGGPAQPDAPPSDGIPKPVQVAQNGDSDAPMGSHPYGGGAAAGPQPSAAPTTDGANGGQLSAVDPTLGGLLKGQFVGNPGGYITQLNSMAARLSAYGQTGTADAYKEQAKTVENALIRSETPEVKNYAVALRQGYQGTMMQFAADKAAQVKSAEIAAEGTPAAVRAKGQAAEATAAGAEQGKAPYTLVDTQPEPGGPIVKMPLAAVLAQNNPAVTTQPTTFADQQKALGKTVAAIPDALRQRQITGERIDAMSNLLETFQSGAGADQKAAAIATARSLGVPLPDSATGSPAAVEQFWKNAQANVFSQIKDQGGKVLVSEIQGFQKANANPNMQPESNAAIIAQQKGLLNWQNAHDQALLTWSQQPANRYAYSSAPFEAQWEAQNKPADYVAAARKEIAPAGIPIPAPPQRVPGQLYNVPGKGVYRWTVTPDGRQGFAPK